MKTLTFLLFFVILQSTYSQELFIEGSKYLELGDYQRADSLFTESLCYYRNENVYFNRGIARFFLGDTIGFCKDMSIASNLYFDLEAAKNYNKICCTRVDTIYYGQNLKPSSIKKHKYFEEIQYPKYDTIATGIVHERNFEQNTASLDFGCDMDIINLQLKKTDIVAEYELIDSIKYYIKTTQKPRILKTDRVEKLKEGESSIFNAKYSKLKSENNLESISIYFQIIISHEGEILDIKFLNTFPVVNAKEYIEDINHDLESFISHFPEINPAQFYGQKVYCRVLDFIEF